MTVKKKNYHNTIKQKTTDTKDKNGRNITWSKWWNDRGRTTLTQDEVSGLNTSVYSFYYEAF